MGDTEYVRVYELRLTGPEANIGLGELASMLDGMFSSRELDFALTELPGAQVLDDDDRR